MLKQQSLKSAFQTYWDDMERCRLAKAYWSLLHVTVCLADICAALEAPNGKATGKRYVDWCDKYLVNPLLVGAERYNMRCKVLHQGRATTDKNERYTGFAFGQPSDTGDVDHMRTEVGTLHLDVGELAKETKQGVEAWIYWLNGNPTSPEAINVEKNLPSLVRVSLTAVTTPSKPGGHLGFTFINKSN